MDKVGDPRMTKNTQGWKCRALPNAMGHAQGRHHGAIHGGTPVGEGWDACVHGMPVCMGCLWASRGSAHSQLRVVTEAAWAVPPPQLLLGGSKQSSPHPTHRRPFWAAPGAG